MIPVRVYDTNALWRHDEIIRIRHLETEIADMQKEMNEIKKRLGIEDGDDDKSGRRIQYV